jgi:hypothetical protein
VPDAERALDVEGGHCGLEVGDLALRGRKGVRVRVRVSEGTGQSEGRGSTSPHLLLDDDELRAALLANDEADTSTVVAAVLEALQAREEDSQGLPVAAGGGRGRGGGEGTEH